MGGAAMVVRLLFRSFRPPPASEGEKKTRTAQQMGEYSRPLAVLSLSRSDAVVRQITAAISKPWKANLLRHQSQEKGGNPTPSPKK